MLHRNVQKIATSHTNNLIFKNTNFWHNIIHNNNNNTHIKSSLLASVNFTMSGNMITQQKINYTLLTYILRLLNIYAFSKRNEIVS